MLSMANMAKQMELFDEGGLMQEGGTVDPVSGNDVPVGSTQEEVRDDIPAQLSEGEFVMPADVVRYHGLDKMMALRDEAKMGLHVWKLWARWVMLMRQPFLMVFPLVWKTLKWKKMDKVKHE